MPRSLIFSGVARRRRAACAFLPALFLTIAIKSALGQGSYEIEIYNSLIAPAGAAMVELHSNFTFIGQELSLAGNHAPVIDDNLRPYGVPSLATSVACKSPTVFFDQVPSVGDYASLATIASPKTSARNNSSICTNTAATSHIGHETVEATTGITSWSELGVYVFSSEQRTSGAEIVGGSIRPKVAVPASWQWPVGAAVSMELEYDRPGTSSDSWSWEIRPIIDRAFGRWYLSANPTIVRTLKGTGTANGVELSPSGKVSFDFTERVTGGVEYYGAYGRIGAFAPPTDRVQQVFGAIDLHLSPLWEINAGIGGGGTAASNHLVAKLILGRSFSWRGSSDTR